MKQSILNRFFVNLIVLAFICCGSKAHASNQFLKVDGQILNRMSIVAVGKIQKPCKGCICSYSNCDKWNFLVFPTTNPRVAIIITGTSKQDIQAKFDLVENWLIKNK